MQKIVALLYPLLVLLLFGLLFFFDLKNPVVIDYDEGLSAEISREMYLDRELVIPTLNSTDFFEKPPMLYWSQMLGYKMFGISSFGARCFNAVSGLATLLIFYFGSAGALGSRTAFNATLILGSSILFACLARIAMPDMLFTMFLSCSLIMFYYGVERARQDRGGASLFWAACSCTALAMLTKGGIGAFFPLVSTIFYLVSIGRPTIIFRRRWFFPGMALILFIGFSWYLALGFVHPRGFSFMRELLLEQYVNRFPNMMADSSGHFFYYLIILLVGFMPWFSFLPLAIVHTPWRSGKNPGARFLRLFLIYSFIVFLFFSLTTSQRPGDILPALPGLALMLACLFNRVEIKHPLFWRTSGYFSALFAFLVGIIIASIPFIFPYLADLLGENSRQAPALAEPVHFGFSLWLAALPFVVCSFFMIRASRRNNIGNLFEALLVSSFIFSASLIYGVLPVYDRIYAAPLARYCRPGRSKFPGRRKNHGV